MFCAKCGKELKENWKICPNCGRSIDNATARPRGNPTVRATYSGNGPSAGGPRPNFQPNYSSPPPRYNGNPSRGPHPGPSNQNGGAKPSPAVILWGAFAGLAVLGAVIFGGMQLSSGKEGSIETLGDYYVTGCKDVVKVREEPDEESDVLTKLSNGEKVSLVDKDDDEYWEVYIKAEEIIGYMSNHYLTNEKEAVTEPVTKYVNIEDGETMTIRSLPKESASAVGILERGQKVTLMADMAGEFDYIYANKSKTYGYVTGAELSGKKVSTATPTPTPAPATETPQPAVQAQPQPQAQPQGKIFGPAAAPVNHLGQYYVSVQKGYLALRNAKAFDSSNEIGQMNNGDYVWAIETGGTYWYVYSPSLGMYGYTNSAYLTTSPVTASRPSGRTYLGVYYANVATGYLALRNATAYDPANEIGKISNGSEVDVIDMSAGEYWYVYVPSLNQEGYVNSQYLR